MKINRKGKLTLDQQHRDALDKAVAWSGGDRLDIIEHHEHYGWSKFMRPLNNLSTKELERALDDLNID